MLANTIAAALRNLVRNKLYAIINIVGLTVGFAAALVIALFVRGEVSYDRWIADANRTFLLVEPVTLPDAQSIVGSRTPAELAAWLKLDFPGIEAIARLCPDHPALRHGTFEANDAIHWADADIFKVLSLPALAGDLATALRQPDSVVLTRRMARKYFGRDIPIGETLEIDRTNVVRVTAVLEDLPANTHLTTEILVSGHAAFSKLAKIDAEPAGLSWGNNNQTVLTYFRLAPGAAAAEVEEAFPDFLKRHSKITGFKIDLRMIPLPDVHLDPASAENNQFPSAIGMPTTRPGGDPKVIFGVAVVGGLITFVALINFVNLLSVRATYRASEIGIRKATGARRRALISQFVGEAVFQVALSMILALAAVVLFLPALNGYLDRSIPVEQLQAFPFVAGVCVFVLVAGLIAGAYPAFVLTGIRLTVMLKGGPRKLPGAANVNQTLVVFQFAVLVGLILVTTTIYRQTDFALRQSIRFDQDQVLLVTTSCKTAFKDEVLTIPGVRAAACSSLPPNEWIGQQRGWKRQGFGERILSTTAVDVGFFELLGVSPIAGRLFSRDYGSDQSGSGSRPTAAVLNETAARGFGFSSPSEAIGQELRTGDETRWASAEIIGVVPDVLQPSVRRPAAPTAYVYFPARFNWLNIKLDGAHIPETIAAIERLWPSTGDPWPIHHIFLDESIRDMYADVSRQSQLLSVFASVAVFIACIGLFGLAAFTAERHTKEIGVRKALGAGTPDILRMLIWQFTKPVVVANLIAWPLAYLVMRRWLDGFAYHIDLEPWMFLGASALALLIAVLTVAGHAWLVARTQPVKALRYE